MADEVLRDGGGGEVRLILERYKKKCEEKLETQRKIAED